MSIAITGARRSGKTYRTYQYIAEKLEEGVSIENICRIQFHDHRLKNITSSELSNINDAYFVLYPNKLNRETVYFVFDEIHRIEGWEDYILYLLDNPLHKVVITGSTSKLLAGEIATGLRGKNFSCQLFPFSFSEFLRWHKIESSVIGSDQKNKVRHYFEQYLSQGGFPGLLELPGEKRSEMLQTYWDTMILRDIIEAHPKDNINIVTFNCFADHMITRTSCPATISKIAAEMELQGHRFSADTLYRYLKYLQEAFIIYTVSFFSKSQKIIDRNYKKVYAIDWALSHAVSSGEGMSNSRRLENLIFLELKRRNFSISYYKTQDNYEVDFVIKEKGKDSVILIQVAYTVGAPGVIEREIRSLAASAVFLKSKSNIILTCDDRLESIVSEGVTIEILPVWEWLLHSK